MCPSLNLEPWLNTLQLCRPARPPVFQTMVQMSTQIPHYLLLFSRGDQLSASEKKKSQFFSTFCRGLEIFEGFSGLYSSYPLHREEDQEQANSSELSQSDIEKESQQAPGCSWTGVF